jgi:hypothetical protein
MNLPQAQLAPSIPDTESATPSLQHNGVLHNSYHCENGHDIILNALSREC